MKKTKILVPALAVLALGMAASVTGTVAWFAANNVVNANGMKIQSTTPSSLAISKAIVDGTGIGKATAIDFETAAETNILNPASHFHGVEENATDDTTFNTGTLYTVTNGNDIDPATGLALRYNSANGLGADAKNNNTGAATGDNYRDLTYGAATLQAKNYVDYTCYIASVGSAITIKNGGYLRAAVNFTGITQTTNAATVDFYVNASGTNQNTSDLGTYMGCLNAVKRKANGGHAGAPLASYSPTITGEGCEYVTLMNPNGNIPINTGNVAVRVTMRVYIDGALLENEAKTYVTTNDVDVANLDLAAVFTLERGSEQQGGGN